MEVRTPNGKVIRLILRALLLDHSIGTSRGRSSGQGRRGSREWRNEGRRRSDGAKDEGGGGSRRLVAGGGRIEG